MSIEENPILAVDLDGTLLRSDMLFETFWAAVSRDWTLLFRLPFAVTKGRAFLKRVLAEKGSVDVTLLPYDQQVIERIKTWREDGGKTALVTASDDAIAKEIAEHLGIFDEAHGSDGETNLKGPNKGDFLTQRYGADGFAYMGDSNADVAVWKQSAKAITVNASPSLQRMADTAAPEAEHLVTQTASVKPYLKCMRPHQWLKNTLIFLPMLAGHAFDGASLLTALMAFVCFSLVASSVYITNDLLDLSADRMHPRKCKRPFAAGDIPIINGSLLNFALLGLGAVLALIIGWDFFAVMLGYYILTTAYSLYLKRQIVIDIYVLAGLYTIRIIAGGVATGIPLSVWLLVFSMFFFLSLAAVKRQAELIDNEKRGKLTVSGRGYHVNDLQLISMIAVSAGYVAVMVMALYLNSPEVLILYSKPQFLWGACLILLFWITRIVMVAHRGGMHDDPVIYAARDRLSQLCVAAIFLLALMGTIL